MAYLCAFTAGEVRDNRLAGRLLSRLKSGAMLLAATCINQAVAAR